MPACMVLDRDVSVDDGLNVLDFLDVRRIAGLVVVMPRRGQRPRIVVNEPLAHFFFFDSGPLV